MSAYTAGQAALSLADSGENGFDCSALEAFLAGRLRLVALARNDTHVIGWLARRQPQPRDALGRDEREVIDLLIQGQSQKQIGIELGVGATTVSSRLHGALKKLQIARWEHLVVVARALTSANASGRPSAGSLGQLPPNHPALGLNAAVCSAALAALTEAEREVALYVIDGRSNAEIGLLRSTSPRTVANQIAAVFRKLSARGRLELILRLLTQVEAVRVGSFTDRSALTNASAV